MKPFRRLATAVALSALGALLPAAANASTPGPAWTITSEASPTHFSPGGPTFYKVRVTNSGGAASDGSPIVITDVLPPRLTLVPAGNNSQNEFGAFILRSALLDHSKSSCDPGPPATCTISETFVQPGEVVWMNVPVATAPGPDATVLNQVSVSGGGASGAAASEPTTISSAPSPFSFQSLTNMIGDSSGAAETRAGAHPYRIQLGFQLATNYVPANVKNAPGGSLRNVRTTLPPGLVVDPNATPVRCTESQLEEQACPTASAVGVVQTIIGIVGITTDGPSSVFNMVPPPGAPAELAFEAANLSFPIHLLGGVDPAGNYVLSADAKDLLQYGNGSGAIVELWGDPSDSSHAATRGYCSINRFKNETCSVSPSSTPFLTMPSACSASLTSVFSAESWEEPGKPISGSAVAKDSAGNTTGVGGCGKLAFDPSIEAQPETSAPDSPTGLHVALHVPQNEGKIVPSEGELPALDGVQSVTVNSPDGQFALRFNGQTTGFLAFNATAAEVQSALQALSNIGLGNVTVSGGPGNFKPFTIHFTGAKSGQNIDPLQVLLKSTSGGEAFVTTVTGGRGTGQKGVLSTEAELATATLKDVSVTLPKGLAVNPSAAEGQGACSETQIGLGKPGSPTCPDNSKLGTVSVVTPLLDHPLPGSIYLARQSENPFGSLLALYVVIDDPASGVVVKLPGKVEPDPNTGQLTATFKENPQLPFEELRTDFFGGPHAALTTPPTCGTYTTTTDLTPWSAPQGKDAFPSDSFSVGGNCASSESQLPNKPAFEAGTQTPLAGSYSPFLFKVSRENGSQRISSVNAVLPPGLVGKLAGLSTCSDAQIAQAASRSNPGQGAQERSNPSCPATSAIGTVTAGAGSGTPTYVSGNAYLSGPYKGAPLSFAFITPAIAGPFDLGTIVVRAPAYVNPETAQITVKSDPIPTILQGIPVDIRSIAVSASRSQFTLNPTSCDPMAVGANALSTLGSNASLSNRFQVGGCKGLDFAPKLALNLKGGTKRGAYPALTATLTQPAGQANIGKISVALPHSEFLAQNHIRTVCTRVQFAANACPAGSIYGKVSATSPLVDYTLSGPVYLRSSSNKLPDLVAVVKGPASQPIEVVSVGRIDSVKGGIRTNFEAFPDVPISKVTLSMQGGKKGLLQNSTNVCRKANKATVKFDGQNGKLSDQSPTLKANCKQPKAKKKKRARH